MLQQQIATQITQINKLNVTLESLKLALIFINLINSVT